MGLGRGIAVIRRGIFNFGSKSKIAKARCAVQLEPSYMEQCRRIGDWRSV